MIIDFKGLLEKAKLVKNTVVGVPAPEDLTSIKTVISVKEKGIADFILCGNKEKIEQLLIENKGKVEDYKIIHSDNEQNAAKKIVSLANEGKVNVILKGFLATASLMKPILDKETGLRTGNLLSDILIVENPADNYDGFLGMSDGGLNILPDLQQKKQMVENAVKVFHKLGYKKPNVGIMTAVEKVKASMPATMDAKSLTDMNVNGEITGCNVYGPLALDIAVSREAAKHKGIENEVAGMVHIMIVPNVEAGNLLGKSFTYYLKNPVAHVVMGAKIPILIPSRNESENDKLYSVALGVIISK